MYITSPGGLPIGSEEGEICGRLDFETEQYKCEGVIAIKPVENCSCHIRAPCSACTASRTYCPVCDWQESDESDFQPPNPKAFDTMFLENNAEAKLHKAKRVYRKLKAGSEEAEAADHMQNVLLLLGIPPEAPGTKDTAERWVRYIKEFTQGDGPLQEVIGDLFDHERGDSTQSMVIQTGIPFRMICEHHLLPAIGKAHIGYLPNHKVVGLSKLPRLVDAIGVMKPSLQEAITHMIARVLMEKAEALGVQVVLEAEHSCMACRGINSPGVNTITSSVLGIYRDVPQARGEFLTLIRRCT